MYVIGVFGILCIFYGSWILWRGIVSQSWPATSAKVLSASTTADQGGGIHLNVKYEFTVQGKRYVSKRVSYGRTNDTEHIEEYQVGTLVRVYYDPKKPTRAVLHPGFDFWPFLVLIAGGCCVLFAVLVFTGALN